MTSTSRIAKQVVHTAKSLSILRASTQAKWDALLASRPSYILFDNPPSHPYTTLISDAIQLENCFDKVLSEMLDVDIGSGTLREELEKIQAIRMYDEVELDSDVERLRLIPDLDATTVTAKTLAGDAMALYHNCIIIRDKAKLKNIKQELAIIHKKKFIVNHIEKPFLSITIECSSAVKEVKSICKLLVALSINGVLVASQLDASSAPKFLQI